MRSNISNVLKNLQKSFTSLKNKSKRIGLLSRLLWLFNLSDVRLQPAFLIVTALKTVYIRG